MPGPGLQVLDSDTAREPGGNRIEVCSGGYLIFDPDHEPVVALQAERATGQHG